MSMSDDDRDIDIESYVSRSPKTQYVGFILIIIPKLRFYRTMRIRILVWVPPATRAQRISPRFDCLGPK